MCENGSSKVKLASSLNISLKSLAAGLAQWCKCSPPTNVARFQFCPSAICGLSLLLVLALLQGFFPGYSSFPPSWKTNISKFQFDQDGGPAWKPAKAAVASSLNIMIYLQCSVRVIILLLFCSAGSSRFMWNQTWKGQQGNHCLKHHVHCGTVS